MKKSHVYILLIVAVLLTAISYSYKPLIPRIPAYNLKEGQIAEYDIIAPFTFNIVKTPSQVEAEEKELFLHITPVYIISEDIKFNALKKVNAFIEIISNNNNLADSATVNSSLRQNGISLSHEALVNILGRSNHTAFFKVLTEKVTGLMNNGIYDHVPYDSVSISEGSNLIQMPKHQLLNISQARSKFSVISIPNINSNTLHELSQVFIIPNIIENKDKTDQLYTEAKSQIQKIIGTVQKNEEIIRKNSRITSDDLQKIQSMQADQNIKENISSLKLAIRIFGNFLLNLFLMLGFYLIMILYFPHHDFTKREIVLIWGGVLFNAIMTIVMTQIWSFQFLLLPYSLSILMICIIFNTNLGLLYNFINFVIVSQFLNWQIFDPLILTIATMGAVLSLKRITDKQDYLNVGIYLLFSLLLVNFAFSLYKTDPFMVILRHFLYSVISATLSIVGLIVLVPWVERRLNIASKQVLLELLDFNHPILKKLASNAMGTYHHSLVVGNLSESAAEAIGANPLLARVGSYYHDIGKISNPQIFTENNAGSDEIHDHLPPLESAAKIRSHVNEGVALARKNKIPQAVIDIIQQHHGTSVIRYFLNKAEKEGLNIDLSKYQYPGPKPCSKEAALVMIADIVEATSKSMNDPSTDAIQKMLDLTILHLIRDGQLDEAPITLQELDLAKKKMFPILESIYRKRLEYPEEKRERESS